MSHAQQTANSVDKLTSIEVFLKEVKADLQAKDGRIEQLENDVKELKKKREARDGRIEQLEKNVEELKKEGEEMKKTVDRIIQDMNICANPEHSLPNNPNQLLFCAPCITTR